MSGIKGQTWKNKREKNKQIWSSIDPELYDRIEKVAGYNRWSMSATVEFIIEKYFGVFDDPR